MKSSNFIERRGVLIRQVRLEFIVIPTILVKGCWIEDEKQQRRSFSKWPELCDYLRETFYRGDVCIKNEANTEYIYLDDNPHTRYL